MFSNFICFGIILRKRPGFSRELNIRCIHPWLDFLQAGIAANYMSQQAEVTPDQVINYLRNK